MKDISIRNSKINVESQQNTSNGKFKGLKDKYISFIKKSSKSDFVNSPVFIEKKIAMLNDMKAVAVQEKLDDEIKWIDSEIASLSDKISTDKKENNFSNYAYYNVSFSGSTENLGEDIDSEKINDDVIQKVLDDEDVTKEEYEKVAAFIDNSSYDYHNYISFIGRCKKAEVWNDDALNAAKILNDAGVHIITMPQIISELSAKDEDGKNSVNLGLCEQLTNYKKMGIGDIDSLHFVKYVNERFNDTTDVDASIAKMAGAQISSDIILDILDALIVPSEDKKSYKISKTSVDNVVSLKKMLIKTKNNEINERNNPISKLGVVSLYDKDFTKSMMIMKDNKVIYSTPTGEEEQDAESVKKQYNDIISKYENKLILEFVNKYKNKSGEIDSKYMRLAVSLRRSGICHNDLFNTMDYCLNSDKEIDNDKLTAIAQLKKAGALSKDVVDILKACDEGKYKDEDLNNACELSSKVIAGKQVVNLLALIRNNEDVKNFFISVANHFHIQDNLNKLANLLKDENNQIDENAMDVTCDIINNLYPNVSGNHDDKIMSSITEILKLAKDAETGKISDECSNLSEKLASVNANEDEIKSILILCKDADGNIDEETSVYARDMIDRGMEIPELISVLSR